jgi:hypothetical protein
MLNEEVMPASDVKDTLKTEKNSRSLASAFRHCCDKSAPAPSAHGKPCLTFQFMLLFFQGRRVPLNEFRGALSIELNLCIFGIHIICCS